MANNQTHAARNLSSVKVRHGIIQTQAEGLYSQALGHLGLGNRIAAEQLINKTIKINPADIGALGYFKIFQ